MSPENPNAAVAAEYVGYNQEPPQEPAAPPPPPAFSVPSRSKAQKLAKVLYGPLARVWINRLVPMSDPDGAAKTAFGVQVGTEQGSEKKIIAQGETFSVALKAPTETYLKGGSNYDETKARFRTVFQFADASEFVVGALKQFPEYEVDSKKAFEKFKKLLEKGARQFASAAAAQRQ